jgi:hypothetical protein
MHCWQAATLRCKTCACATYCSAACQKAHWKSGHKLWCKEPLWTAYAGFAMQNLYELLTVTLRRTQPLTKANPDSDDPAEAHPQQPSVWRCTSVGSGLAIVEYALLVMHQRQPHALPRLVFTLVDPDPTSFLSIQKKPALAPQYGTITDLPVSFGTDCMLLLWPDHSGYDIQAVVALHPPAFFILYEEFGVAGSDWMHAEMQRWGATAVDPTAVAIAKEHQDKLGAHTRELTQSTKYERAYEGRARFRDATLPSGHALFRSSVVAVFSLTHVSDKHLRKHTRVSLALRHTPQIERGWEVFRAAQPPVDQCTFPEWTHATATENNRIYKEVRARDFPDAFPTIKL